MYVKDWGKEQPIVFSRGWPLSADAWEDQMFSLASRGYRCVAPDSRRIGRGIHSECRSGPLTKGVPSAPGDTPVTGDSEKSRRRSLGDRPF